MEPTPTQRFREALSALGGIADPGERAVRGHELQQAMKASAAHVRATVDEAVAELRSGMSLAQIAELLGVSVQRISQIAASKHGTARPWPSLIYAFRVLGGEPGPWHGEPKALPEGSFITGTIDFNPATPGPFSGKTLEVRYGPVADDGLPTYLQGYTTVNGRSMRATALVQDVLFGTSLAGTWPSSQRG